MLFAVLRGTGLSEWVVAFVALVVLFVGGGAGAENPLWDFQVGFLGPAVLGLSALLMIQRSRRRSAQVLASVALVAGLTFSGTALVVAVLVGAYAWLARGRMAAVGVIIPVVGTYAAWFVVFARGHYMPHGDPRLLPRLFVHGIDSVWSDVTFIPGTGWLAFVALIGGVMAERGRRAEFALGAASLIALVFAYLLFSYVGTRFGPYAATQSRYCYYGILLSSPALAVLLDRLLGWHRIRIGRPTVWWGAAAGLTIIVGTLCTAAWTHRIRGSVRDLPEVVVAAQQIAAAGEPLLSDQPAPRLNPDLRLSALLRSKAATTLPQLTPSRTSELDARVNLQVSFSPVRAHPKLSAMSHLQRTDLTCSTAHATSGTSVRVQVPPSGVELEITAIGDDATIETRLASGNDSSWERPWPIRAGQPEFVASTASGFVLEIEATAGRVTVCPAG